MSDSAVVDKVFDLFATAGSGAYFGERVSQQEHALQAAHFAREAKASDSQVIAALLHDVGHLLHDQPENIADEGVDTVHEQLGYEWLSRHFPPSVCEPVRLHVDAKRYLCRVEPSYFAGLSAASVQSLQLQGGPFNDAEVADFESNPFFREAVALRRWDDTAKIEGLTVPPLEEYRLLLETALSAKTV